MVEKISPVSYPLELPPNLAHVHYTFYISLLKRFFHKSNERQPPEAVMIDDE